MPRKAGFDMVRVLLMILMIATTVALSSGHAMAQRGSRRDRGKDEQLLHEIVSPQGTFARIERAWKAGDAQAIASFVGKSKVLVQVGSKGPGGFYSRAQILYLLKKMFKEADQLRFEFAKFHNLEKPGRKVYAIAYRSSRDLRSDKVFQDKVYITLGKEGKAWVIVEIKTTG